MQDNRGNLIKSDQDLERVRDLNNFKTPVQETKISAESNILQYKKVDSSQGFLEDVKEIEEYKRTQTIDIMQNALLGQYDENGEYCLDEDIKSELKKCRKVITNNYENFIFLQAIREIQGFGKVTFYVNVEKKSDNLRASLILVEQVRKINGYIINTESYILDVFQGQPNEQFYFDMKKEFNIVADDFIDVEDSLDEFKATKKKKDHRRKIWLNSLNQIEKTEKNLFQKKLELLQAMGNNNPYVLDILEMFKLEKLKLGEIFLNNKPNKYLTLNEILDDCIIKAQGKHAKEYELSIKNALDLARANVKDEQRKIFDMNGSLIREGEKKTIENKETIENKVNSQKSSSSQGNGISKPKDAQKPKIIEPEPNYDTSYHQHVNIKKLDRDIFGQIKSTEKLIDNKNDVFRKSTPKDEVIKAPKIEDERIL